MWRSSRHLEVSIKILTILTLRTCALLQVRDERHKLNERFLIQQTLHNLPFFLQNGTTIDTAWSLVSPIGELTALPYIYQIYSCIGLVWRFHELRTPS